MDPNPPPSPPSPPASASDDGDDDGANDHAAPTTPAAATAVSAATRRNRRRKKKSSKSTASDPAVPNATATPPRRPVPTFIDPNLDPSSPSSVATPLRRVAVSAGWCEPASSADDAAATAAKDLPPARRWDPDEADRMMRGAVAREAALRERLAGSDMAVAATLPATTPATELVAPLPETAVATPQGKRDAARNFRTTSAGPPGSASWDAPIVGVTFLQPAVMDAWLELDPHAVPTPPAGDEAAHPPQQQTEQRQAGRTSTLEELD
ncbi:hypothetical protein HK405_004776 [Cladochytrium tenue]|nr:hypothetical protein HK405_004776 [Cladochytrium tenue]